MADSLVICLVVVTRTVFQLCQRAFQASFTVKCKRLDRRMDFTVSHRFGSHCRGRRRRRGSHRVFNRVFRLLGPPHGNKIARRTVRSPSVRIMNKIITYSRSKRHRSINVYRNGVPTKLCQCEICICHRPL